MGIATYGSCLARSFGLPSAATLTSRMADGCMLAVTGLRQDGQDTVTTLAFGRDDACLLALQLRGPIVHKVWMDGAELTNQTMEKGSVWFYDVGHAVTATITGPFHCLLFHIPRSAIAATCKALGLRQIHSLQRDEDNGSADAIIQSIGDCLLPQLHAEPTLSQPFVDHLFQALLNHLVVRHASGIESCTRPSNARGGLAAWQQRRAQELMREHLIEGIALAQMAEVCRLSTSAFSRGFRISTGVSPHEWLLQRRIDCALEMMRATALPLADIALRAGFTDQSHFTRSFGKRIGVSPGAWRRASGPHENAVPPPTRDRRQAARSEHRLQARDSRRTAALRVKSMAQSL